MKISRNKSAIKSSEELVEAAEEIKSDEQIIEEPIVEDEDLCDELGIVPSPKELACKCIKDSIDHLSGIAREDEIARDAIANLSVVLLDLQ